jgi:hypothetical protein
MVSDPSAERTDGRSKRWFRWIAGLIGILVALLLVAPWLIAKTALRDRLINSVIKGDQIVVSTRGARFGYVSPVEIDGLSVKVTDGSAHIQIESIAAEESWLAMLLSPQDLGTFTFQKPQVDVVTGIGGLTRRVDANETAVQGGKIPAEEPDAVGPQTMESDSVQRQTEQSQPDAVRPQASDPRRTLPQLAAVIEGASVTVRDVARTEPAVDLQDLNVSFRVEHHGHGAVVVIDPVTLLDQQTLSPELCGQGLQLVAPMLADGVDVQGRLSLRLDRFFVPVGEMDDQQRRELMDIAGEIKLDGVSVALTNPLTTKLFELAARFSRRELPDALTVAEAAAVRFEVKDGRVHQEGLTFLLPYDESSLAIASRGSVGVDETLDLELSITLPGVLLGRSALTKFLVEEPLLIHVGGTVQEPTIELPEQENWISRLGTLLHREHAAEGETKPAEAGLDPSVSEESESAGIDDSGMEAEDSGIEVAESILGIVGGLLEDADERQRPAVGGLRQRLQERRERRRGR